MRFVYIMVISFKNVIAYWKTIFFVIDVTRIVSDLQTQWFVIDAIFQRSRVQCTVSPVYSPHNNR